MTEKVTSGQSERHDPITASSEWTFEFIQEFDRVIGNIALEYRLDTYPNQIEIISSEQMMDAYSSVGMPVGYNHWSFGKQFLQTQNNYKRGFMGLAYEIVINSNPCIAYLMEENTMAMQALVIAHACYGHNSFFKNNYLFKTWTDATAIIDYLVFAKNYVSQCENRYGVSTVETFLDSCHALQNYGVDRYKRPSPISAAEEANRQQEREDYMQQQINLLWRTIPTSKPQEQVQQRSGFPAEPEENLLYFIEKNAPLLEPWQRELVRIVRKIGQYFYPQRQTQVMNEGWASFWHYTLMNTLYDRGYVNEGFMIEFLNSHASVVYQPPYDSKYYSGINPYCLGFNMFRDIRRMCEEPTEEDYAWFPDVAGKNWLDTVHFAMENFKDESFIQQYLSPKVMRDMRLFCVFDDENRDEYEIAAIHDEMGYEKVRAALAEQYNLSTREPNIQVVNVDLKGDRSLTLRHTRHNNVPLNDECEEVLKHVYRLWGFDVHLESVQGDEVKNLYHMPVRPKTEEEKNLENLKYV
ncbi:SpoVR family protein [Reinekea marinisedimentorum]|uniref:Spore cortex formation protein SpoVR/YcgB (Stage V sporulation) n=1 Tax=Reinekea marinisedimentorum TaxID=230495 RepID=A0A4R3I7R1_9GAMM|nr:SpoVR family protein [Reinekea marinisedimentorum]TCS40171.1 spore cortex formation protein SpoVR/YcgB (stage V sporulation) [Reinekea marinisedimentorum]